MSQLNLEDYNSLVDKAADTYAKEHNVEVTIFRHLKTGKHYFKIGRELIQCTNGHEAETYIMYSDGIRMYVREAEEFYQKFS